MNGIEYQAILRTINCLSYPEFVEMFGDSLGNHLFSKFENLGIKFLFELDNQNINTIVEAAKVKRSKRAA